MVRIILEGAAPNKYARAQAREAFKKLMVSCGCNSRKFRFEPWGGRDNAFNEFRKAVRMSSPDEHCILLVDSEDAVSPADASAPDGAWRHLKIRDNWNRPAGCVDAQAQLMATCMETWIMSNPATLSRLFPNCLRRNTLFAPHDLEQRHRHAVQDTLELATRDCGRDRGYVKGRKSFDIISELDANALRELSHFVKFENALHAAIAAQP